MNAPFVQKRVKVVNPQGLHARPADMFVRLANRFRSDVRIGKGSELVDGKSIMMILTLGAEQGTELTIDARGDDAHEAIAALAELVENGFAQDALDGPQMAGEH